MKSPLEFLFKSRDFSDLGEWRGLVLDGILRGIFVIWMFGLASGVYNVVEAYRHEGNYYDNPFLTAGLTMAIYLGTTLLLAFITFNRKLKLGLRAGLLLFIFYILGTTGMVLSSFSGDGRVFFFALIILAAMLFDLRYSLAAFSITFLTMAMIGYLQVSGALVVPVGTQINASDAGAWISSGIVLFLLSMAALISITYLLQGLGKSLNETREVLAHQQRLSRILHTISDIHQLIIRETDLTSLLTEACRLLAHGRGYAFSWVGLLKPDQVTLKLAAYAGDIVDASKFDACLEQEGNSLICVENAMRSKSYFQVQPSADDLDPCQACPRRIQYPHRSAIALPLLREDHSLGVLVVANNSPIAFDAEEIDLLQNLTNDLAFAVEKLENDRLLQTKMRSQSLLVGLTQVALEASDLSPMLQMISERLQTTMNADACFIILQNEQQQLPAPIAASGSLQEILFQLDTEREELGTVLKLFGDESALVLNEAKDDARISPQVTDLLSLRSLLGLPLVSDRKHLGGIFIVFHQSHHFTPDEVELGKQVSGQVALAVTKMDLLAETRANALELSKLYAAAQDMASSLLDPSSLLKKFARHMTEALNCTRGNIVSIDPDRSQLTVLAEYVSDQASAAEHASNLGRVSPIDDYKTVMQSIFAGRTMIIHADTENLTKMEHEPFKEYGVQSMLLIPIMTRGKLIGNAEVWESRAKRDFSLADIRLAQAMAGHAASIIENARLFETLEQREAYFRALIENSTEGVAILDADGIIQYVAPAETSLTGYSVEEMLGHSAFQTVHPDDLPAVLSVFREIIKVPGAIKTIQYRIRDKAAEWHYFETTGYNLLDDPYLAGVVINYRDISEQQLAEQALKESQTRLEGIISTALNAIITINSQQNIVLFNPYAEKIFGWSAEDIIGKPLDVIIPDRYRQIHRKHVRHYGDTGVTNRSKGIMETLRGVRANGEEFPMEAYISMVDIRDEKYYTVILQDITERRQAEEELRRHAHELETLAMASAALRTAQNVAEMIPILVRQALRAVEGDYGSIFLLDPETGDYVSNGWYSTNHAADLSLPEEGILRHQPSQGITGYVATTGEIYITKDIRRDPKAVVLNEEADRLQRISGGISLPIRAEVQVIGVLHIWMEKERIFNETDIRLLIALAETAGNAIHRAMLFEQIREHAEELVLAYDHTLVGWARALELRDELTEGHTRRVTDLTMQLAHALDIPEADLIHIRRGALLHDIGKMGIPDSILHKPGPLSAQERMLMSLHPQYAYDMLSPISFLRPALDIPYCHHERWDGAGYPRGLRGEEIPLPARIFSVVDVWDALTSDRPYRPAWTKEEARQYLIERAGTAFDPKIVEIFLSLDVD